MKKTVLFSVICMALCASSASAEAPNKMTYEKALQSHKNTYGKYQAQSVTPEQSQLAWDSYEQQPEKDPGGSNGAALEEVWTGSATSVPVTWGQGDYYVEIHFGHDNQGGSAWLTVDNSSTKKNVAVPSSFQYEGNYHIEYASGILRTKSIRASGTPKITRISKFPTPQLDECTAGKVETNTLHCSSGKTCETGKSQRQCASNGGWAPWQTLHNPICVAKNKRCP